MARILVTETLADRGLQAMRAAGHAVEVQTGLTPEQLLRPSRARKHSSSAPPRR